MENPAGQDQVFLGGDGEQVPDQSGVVGAGAGTGLKHPAGLEKEHLRVGGGRHADHQRLIGQAGIGLGKDLAGAGLIENAPVAPDVAALNVDAAAQNQTHGLHGVAGAVDDGSLLVGALNRPQARQHGGYLFRSGAAEERRLRQTCNIHISSSMLE